MVEPDRSSALATTDSSTGLDPYERRYMAKGGALLHRTKRPAPRWLQALLGSMALTGLVFLATPQWVTGLVFVPVGIIIWALFSVLRLTVTENLIHVQYGLFGPRIPIASVESVEATTYSAMEFGGWGIRRSPSGESMYNMPGDDSRAVRIVWRDEKGRRVITNVGMPDPQPSVDAIERARKQLSQRRASEALSQAHEGPTRDETDSPALPPAVAKGEPSA